MTHFGLLGTFKEHAVRWQRSPGCLVAGFLGVFSSELSVFTLSVITLERYYAISHALQINKRLTLRHSGTVKFVYKGHSSDLQKVAFIDKWPLYRG